MEERLMISYVCPNNNYDKPTACVYNLDTGNAYLFQDIQAEKLYRILTKQEDIE